MFAFRLCLFLGVMHPDYLLPQLTSRQIAEWMAYFQLKPFGQDHTDFLIAQLTTEFTNRNRGKNEKQYKVADFLPLHRTPPMSTDEIRQTIRNVLRGSRRKS